MSEFDLELAKQRGDRHRIGAGQLKERFDVPDHGSVYRVRVVAEQPVAETAGGQHALWMLVNLLARQFTVIHEIHIAVPPVPMQVGVALFGEGSDLPQSLAETARLVAGPAMRVLVVDDRQAPVDVEASVGGTGAADEARFRIGGIASGWRVAVGDPRGLPQVTPSEACAFGPYFAACLVAGEVFKRLSGLREGRGRFITSLQMSLWDWQERECWAELADGDWPQTGELPPLYLIGAGAVGQGTAAALAASRPLRGLVTVIDGDQIDAQGTNLNRYPLATGADLGAPKAKLLVQHLLRAGFQAYSDDRHWPAYAHDPPSARPSAELGSLEADYRYRLVLSCVDKNPARHAVQNFWPEYVIGGSTSDMALSVAAYDMRSPYECLKCANPLGTTGLTVEELTEELRALSPEEQHRWARERHLDEEAVLQHLSNPSCGTLGEQEISRFARAGGGADWSVGFVSVAAGTVLAAQTVKYALLGPAAFPPSTGNTLRFSFLQPRPRASAHQRKPGCDCLTSGRAEFERLWVNAAK